MQTMERYLQWLQDPYFDGQTRKELAEIKEDPKEIEDRFYRELEFGTGGLRGVMGAGTNRMNIYTVRKATQGLANYILGQGGERRGVAVAYDSRNNSERFAKETAACLAANGIRVFLFPALKPTPMLSFAVRNLGCIAGVVITASHNPAQYNGYKVYWEDGAQITPPHDEKIIACVREIEDFSQIKVMELKDALDSGLCSYIDDTLEQAYLQGLKALVLRPEVLASEAPRMSVVYTPLHGAGAEPVQRLLKELGFEKLYTVPEQEKPDGNFPTVAYPNPEEPLAFQLALELAAKVGAELVFATDPDSDRLGFYAKDEKTGEYRRFTGNMAGALLLDYQLSQRKALGLLPENGAVVNTIVTGRMAEKIAEFYGVRLVQTLTGFKYIGEKIKEFERDGSGSFLFGFEESYGCLLGTQSRDKDAVVAAMAVCEAAAYYHAKGSSLCEQMELLYKRFGYYREGLFTLNYPGQEGAQRIASILEGLRSQPPRFIGGAAVEAIRDYRSGLRRAMADGAVTALALPKSNVLYFELAENCWCCVRPSGTEPKVKLYYGVCGKTAKDAEERLSCLEQDARKLCGQ